MIVSFKVKNNLNESLHAELMSLYNLFIFTIYCLSHKKGMR